MEAFNTSERFVEVPWCLNRHGGAQVVLDCGYANAEQQYLEKLASLNIPDLHGLDVAPPKYFTVTDAAGVARPLLKPAQSDLRKTPYPDDFFDLIFCVSTVEHIGLDNEAYQSAPTTSFSKYGDMEAVREMYRITKPRGRLLLTVPFGKFQYFGWFLQYDLDRLCRLVAASDYHTNVMQFFKYSNGWNECYPDDLKDTVYQANGAPAAAGVACLELEKVEYLWQPGKTAAGL